MANVDATAVEKGLRELAVPFFHHEFVRQAVMQALHSAESESSMLSLLGQLSECGLVSSNQLAKVILPSPSPVYLTAEASNPARPVSGMQALQTAGVACFVSGAGLVCST